jgi:hypothetical protein
VQRHGAAGGLARVGGGERNFFFLSPVDFFLSSTGFVFSFLFLGAMGRIYLWKGKALY